MTVAELIEELRAFPQHHPVMINADFRYNEPILQIVTGAGCAKTGPSVVIRSESDPRNDPEPEVWRYDGSEP
jgi:hypothetical protein